MLSVGIAFNRFPTERKIDVFVRRHEEYNVFVRFFASRTKN